MNLHRRAWRIAALIVVAALSGLPMPSARAADNLQGNPVPGVCMLSREAVFAQAKVGQAASQQLGQLAEQARNQLAGERKPLDADVQSFQQKESSLSEAQRKEQTAALQQRMQTLQAQADNLNERIQLTRAKAMQRIGQEAETIVAGSYESHHCGLLLNRDSVLAGNMTNDLTSDVVQGLDRRITTVTLNLEPLPSGNGASGNGK